jgi:hypothetical protein
MRAPLLAALAAVSLGVATLLVHSDIAFTAAQIHGKPLSHPQPKPKPKPKPEPLVLELPNGERIDVAPGEKLQEERTKNGQLERVTIEFADGTEHWTLTFAEDGKAIVQAMENRPDGTTKRKLQVEETSLTITTYYEDGDTIYSEISANKADGSRILNYKYRDGLDALHQDFDTGGFFSSQIIYSRDGNVLIEQHSYEDGTTVSYSGKDGGTELELNWRSPIGSAEPTVHVNVNDGQGNYHEFEFVLTADGRRIVRMTTENDNGTKTVDTLAGDGHSIVLRQTLNYDGAVIAEHKPNTLRSEIPRRYFAPPLPPIDPISLGLHAPN